MLTWFSLFINVKFFYFFENSQTYVGDILIALNPFKPLEIYHKSVRMNIRSKLWSTFEFAVIKEVRKYTCSEV